MTLDNQIEGASIALVDIDSLKRVLVQPQSKPKGNEPKQSIAQFARIFSLPGPAWPPEKRAAKAFQLQAKLVRGSRMHCWDVNVLGASMGVEVLSRIVEGYPQTSRQPFFLRLRRS